jgi:steroid delta-isomerase-like uncharacterized protein
MYILRRRCLIVARLFGDPGYNAVAVEWIATGTHSGDFPGLPATGNPFHIRGISMIELEGDQVRRASDYWDLASSGLLSPLSEREV